MEAFLQNIRNNLQ